MRPKSLAVVGGLAAIALAGCSSGSRSTTPPSTVSTTTVTSVDAGPVYPTAIPLGDGKVSPAPGVGSVFSCQQTFGGGGAFANGPWINGSTWNATTKLHVAGAVSWPQASYSVTVEGGDRVITTNDLPKSHTTGVFPVAADDPAYRYDRNPNTIVGRPATFHLAAKPTPAAQPTCVGLGPIGVLSDGVYLFDALDAGGRDAAAHEVLDKCDGHPERAGTYHHHTVPSCIQTTATGPSTLVGYALDGFGIFVERSAGGQLLTDGDLDECHGRTSDITWDGQTVSMYHYVATTEYPYTVGCYRGTATRAPR